VTRWLVLAAAVLYCAFSVTSARADAVAGTTVSGGDMKHPVRLTAADELTFLRRINLPPKLDDAPFNSYDGPSYTVATDYWDSLLYGWKDTKGHAADTATYYPKGGYIKTKQDDKDVWLVIDLRQQAILNRYIRLGAKDAVPEKPTLQQMLVASSDEPISVDIGSHSLTDTERAAFWKALAQPMEAVLSAGANTKTSDGVWITFNLPEGRDLQLFYDINANRLVDGIGGDGSVLPRDWLQPVLGANAPHAGAPGLVGAKAVPQEASTGSPVWWVIMIGGGLTCIAAALVVRRKLA
jgi:hypothetical protein